MTVTAATHGLDQRHAHFVNLRCRLRAATGPVLHTGLTWPAFWDHVNITLKSCGYAAGTRRQYRNILRGLRHAGIVRPLDVTAGRVKHYIQAVAARECSWSWVALHITALRTIFDELCDRPVTRGLVTPRRGYLLPQVLGAHEAEAVVRAGVTIRDQLLLGLLYGCGLSGSEVCALRWRDVGPGGATLHVRQSARYAERTRPVPVPLQQVLAVGRGTCVPAAPVFAGRSQGVALSRRAVEQLVRRAVAAAGIDRPVSVMTLRHSYAIHRLENGAHARMVQAELGLASVRTMTRYTRCINPVLKQHPFSRVRARMAELEGCAPSASLKPAHPSSRADGRPLAALEAIDVNRVKLPFTPIDRGGGMLSFGRLLTSRLYRLLLRPPPPH